MINTIENQIKELENKVVELATFRDDYMSGYREMITTDPKLYNAWISTGAAIMSLQQAIKDLNYTLESMFGGIES